MNDKLVLIFGIPEKEFYDRLKEKKVFVAELRPGLEGAKIVAAQLLKKKIQPVIICDNMMARLMQQGLVKEVNIFSYGAPGKKSCQCRSGALIAALCAREHNVSVYLYPAGPALEKNTLLSRIEGLVVAAANIKTYAPLFEEVPLDLVNQICSH